MFPMDGIILAMGIFYGGIAQIFAGLLEYKKGNTFGLTAFTSYGSFWLTLVAILLLPKMGLADAANATSWASIWASGACSPCLCSSAR
jgi:succinate-acetate transporter protein